LSLSEDHQYVHTPVGDFPVNISTDDMNSVLSKVATSMGYSPAGIAAGIAAGTANAQTLAAQAQAEVAAAAQSMGGNRQVASASAGASTTNKADLARAELASKNVGKSPAQAYVPSAKGDIDWAERARQLAGYRAQLEKAMHLEPIGGKDDDIFKMIHTRYTDLHEKNIFLAPTEALRAQYP
jgi:hypothetical protein